MKQLIIKKIDFKLCYQFLILNLVLMIASYILYSQTIIPKKTLQLSTSMLTLLLTLYGDLGYVKYSFLKNEKLLQIIIATIGISIIQSPLAVLDATIGLDQTKYTIYTCVAVVVSTPLLIYAFWLIKNEEMTFFRRLSKFNMYLPIIFLFGLAFYLLKWTWFFLWFPLVLAFFAVLILRWYWEIRLFKHLSLKYKET